MNIRYHYGFPPLYSRTADASADRNAHAGGLALEGTQDKLRPAHEIEPGPVQVGQELIDQRRHVGRVGDSIRLTLQKGSHLLSQRRIKVALAVGLWEWFGLEHRIHL